MKDSSQRLDALVGGIIEAMSLEMARAERVLPPDRYKMLERVAKPVAKALTRAAVDYERYAHAYSRLMGGSTPSQPPGRRGNVHTLRPPTRKR